MNVVVVKREGNEKKDYDRWEEEINKASNSLKADGCAIQTIVFRDNFAVIGYHRAYELEDMKIAQDVGLQQTAKKLMKDMLSAAD